MSNRTFTLSDDLYEYILSVSLREDPLLQQADTRVHISLVPIADGLTPALKTAH